MIVKAQQLRDLMALQVNTEHKYLDITRIYFSKVG